MNSLRQRVVALVLGAAAASVLFGASSPSASAAVAWQTQLNWAPPHLVQGEDSGLIVEIANMGDTVASVPIEVRVDLPPGVTALAPLQTADVVVGGWTCTGAGTEVVECVASTGLFPGFGLQPPKPSQRMAIRPVFDVEVAADAPLGVQSVKLTASGGGAAEPFVEELPIKVSDTPLGFGIDPDTFEAGAFDDEGDEFTQSAGHPFNAYASFLPSYAGQTLADIVATLPPGFVGDPTVVEQCTEAFLFNRCPPESQVGLLQLFAPGIPEKQTAAVYNMKPPPGLPAQFAFTIPFAGPQRVNPSVRSDGDYGITMTVPNITEAGTVTRSKLIIWGAPADPANDIQRCHEPHAVALVCTGLSVVTGEPRPTSNPRSSSLPERALLSNPTNCADVPRTSLLFGSYQNRPRLDDLDDPRWARYTIQHSPVTGCPAVPFDPTIDFEPTANSADTPSGLDVHLNIPRGEDGDGDGIADDSEPDGLVQAHLKKTTVKLPAGVAFNASAADGIAGCTPQQIGLVTAPGESPYRFDNVEPSCPPASKVANAKVVTPLLPNPLAGEVFLASQDDNPFDSTFAIYIVVREPSILVKLPGRVDLDSATGQITTTFDDNPQLPFSDLELDFFGGPRGSIATPKTCGTFTTTTRFVPWSAADPDNPAPGEVVTSNDRFTVDHGPNGRPCVSDESQLPFDLGLEAGSHNPVAGQTSDYSIRLTRPDGAQELDRVSIRPPAGFTASLKGVPYCSEEQIQATASRDSGRDERASSTCPAASQIGSTLVGAGAGSNPLYTPGKVYLAGPYKGAPLSAVAVTPAVAGPFDLGNVVVRAALRIHPRTAEITAEADPLPRTIAGVPLRIRDIRIAIDRPQWALNPTNCSEMAFAVDATGTAGASTTVSNRFQLSGCRNLRFKPRMALRLYGGTKRAAHPAFRAVVRPRPGDANIGRAAVTLPSSAFLDQAHIRTICTRVQFAADKCPKAAIYGRAKAWTPLLDQPLQGPVYLRSSNNNLPDLVADLRGPAHQPIRIELVGRIDSVSLGRGTAGIRNVFGVVPDAPVSRFVLQMQGGKKGLITNSRNLCARPSRAVARLKGQNGRRHNFRPRVVAVKCKKKVRKAKRSAHSRKAR